jgi:threonine/homoserine efflux transporter RhtA
LIGLVMAATDRLRDRPLLAVAGLVELAAFAQSVLAAIELARGHEVSSTATVIGYLIGNVLILPIAVVWAWAERTRWTPAVVALGGVTVAVMTGRLGMMWAGRG